MNHELKRLERKIDLILQLQGVTLVEVEQLNTADDAKIKELIAALAKSKTKHDALKAALAAQ